MSKPATKGKKSKKEEALAFLDDLDNFEVVPSPTTGAGAAAAAPAPANPTDSTSAGAAAAGGESKDRPATPAGSTGSARPSGQHTRTATADAPPRASHDSQRSVRNAASSQALAASSAADDAEAAQALAFLEAQIAATSSSKRPMSRVATPLPPSGSGAATPTAGTATLGAVLQPPSGPRDGSRPGTPVNLPSSSPRPGQQPQSTTSRWGTSFWSSASTVLASVQSVATEVQKNAEKALETAQTTASQAAAQAQAAAGGKDVRELAGGLLGEVGARVGEVGAGAGGLVGGLQERMGGRLGELQGLIAGDRLKGVDLERLRADIMTRGNQALTDLLNTVAPPISEHEVLQVWLTHEMIGYDGVESVVYKAVGNIMEQTASTDLEVFFSPPPKTKPSATAKGKQPEKAAEEGEQEEEEERTINPVKGWEAAYAKIEDQLREVKERAALDARGGTVNPDIPVTTIPVYMHIQPVIVPSPYLPPGTATDTSNSHITFLISMLDSAHSISRTTVAQFSPADWLDVEYEKSDWVEERLVEVLRNGVETVVQEYVAIRMGLKETTPTESAETTQEASPPAPTVVTEEVSTALAS